VAKFIGKWVLLLLSAMIAACSSGGGSNQLPSMSKGDEGGSGLEGGGPPGLPQLQMAMSSIDIPAGTEVYKCQDFDNPFGKDIAIVSSESVMSPGSHHFAAFRIAGLAAGPMIDCPSGGLEAHEFIHAAQQVDQTTSYPPNVGRFLPATDGLRLMVHYLNATGQPKHADGATFSMQYVDADQIQSKAAGVFLNNIGISVPPGQSSAAKSFALQSDIKLLVAVSHMHSHGVGFTSSTSDGRHLFDSTQWSEPRATEFKPPMEIGAGTTIAWTCSFQNDTGRTLTFGQSAATDEMCIFNGVYYPSPNGDSIVQNLP
jgi:hypothetical protein